MKNNFTVRSEPKSLPAAGGHRELLDSLRSLRRTKVLLLVSCLVFLAAACNRTETLRNDAVVNLAGKTLTVQVAATALEQASGLSTFESLDESHGMLFPTDPPGRPAFWMKNMKFPIDIVWIKGNEVVDLSLNAEPEPDKQDYQLMTYVPQREVDVVLELKAGWATKNNVKIGDPVVIEYRAK